MLIDFHCHIPYRMGIVCTDSPQEVPSALVRCVGLLPANWTEENQERLFDMLRKDPGMHLGEVGLDRRFQVRIPMQEQVLILKGILKEALSLGRSVSLHCVQATGLMLETLSSLDFRPYSILWHGFTGSAETARELERLKVLISLGPRTRSPLSAEGHYVLESDYDGFSEEEHQTILSGIYNRFAFDTGKSIEELSEHCSAMLELFNPPH